MADLIKYNLFRKSSKTLPRGFVIGPGSETSGDSVFGLYGDLMNVEDYDYGSVSMEATNKDSHRLVNYYCTNNVENASKMFNPDL